jgi:PPOX class probable F420-dependent enzyme
MLRPMLTHAQRQFLDAQRVGHLATVEPSGAPHLVPVCYGVAGGALYITVDEKPKQTGLPLKRLRNIAANPVVAVTVDRWDEDWSRLGWVMLTGPAEVLAYGEEHDAAQERLRARYPQYRAMDIGPLPVIALRIARVRAWGAV